MCRSSPLILALVLIALGFLAACHSFFRMKGRHMSIRPVESWDLKPQPIGRFLVGWPQGAVVGRWYQRYCGTGRISVARDVSPEQYDDVIERRIGHLRSMKHDNGGCLFIKDQKLSLPYSRSILFFKSRHYDTDPLKVDDYLLKGGSLYKFEGETWKDPEEQESYFQFVDEMFRAIRPLQPDEIPTEHGFCFDHSILVDAPRPRIFENVIVSAIWLDRPDVHFGFTTFGNGETLDPPLLSRIAKATLFSGTRVLRSGPRTLGSGDPGQEHLERVREGNGTVGHLFIWEGQGLPNDQYEHPQIRLDMSTGNGRKGPENASLSDADAMRLWDTILDSVRLRPVIQAPKGIP